MKWALVAFVILLSSHHPRKPHWPAWWMRQAACIRAKESGGRWHIRNSPYGGAYQFVDSTWTRFAPRRWPMSFSASPAQQTLVAHRVWVANGHRWGGSQWPLSSRACGVA